MNELTDVLACPRCGGDLARADSALSCRQCRFQGAERSGIIDLRARRYDYYFNPVERSVMRELTSTRTAADWPATIRRFLREVDFNPDWLDNLVVDGRYAWKLFLSPGPNATLLDLGCGLGSLIQNLAPLYARTFGLDLTWERLEFTKMRLSLLKPGDSTQLVAGGDGERLPFKDHSFDCITLSGVLEWIADTVDYSESRRGRLAKALQMFVSIFGATNPRREQLAFLNEIRRILKPAGQVFIGIENRLNYEYFLGRRDHHSGLLFGSLLPRAIANLYSIARSHQPYRTYTYSKRAYRRLLNETGLSRVRFLGLAEGYSKLCGIYPDPAWTSRWYEPPPVSLKDRLKRSQTFVPAYGILAAMEEPGPSIWDRILQQVPRDLESESSVSVTDLLVTGKDKAVALASCNGRRIVVKIPLNESSQTAEENNWRILRALASRTPLIPHALAKGSLSHCSYFVEDAMPGRPLSDEIEDDAILAIGSIGSFVKAQSDVPGAFQRTVFSSELLDTFIDVPVRVLAPITNLTAQLDRLQQRLRASLASSPVVSGVMHGDLSLSNIHVQDGRITGIIDWEYGSLHGIPFLDVLGHLESRLRWAKKLSTMEALRVLSQGRYGVEIGSFLEEMLELHQVSSEELPLYLHLYWLHQTSIRVSERLQYQEDQIAIHVDRYLGEADF